MEIQTKAQLLTAVSKPYSFAGGSGTSHKIRFNVAGEIFICSSTAEQVESFLSSQAQNGLAVFKFSSPKENLKMHLVSFVKDKN